jgi:hypothetical protein
VLCLLFSCSPEQELPTRPEEPVVSGDNATNDTHTEQPTDSAIPENQPEPVTLTIDLPAYIIAFLNMREKINHYHKSHPEVNIVMSSKGDTPEFTTRMIVDLLSGTAGDIIVSSGFHASGAKKGFFTELYEFLDNDPDISRESFFENILRAAEVNGKLYGLPYAPYSMVYRVSTMYWPYIEDELSNKGSLTVTDILDFYEKVRPYVSLSEFYPLTQCHPFLSDLDSTFSVSEGRGSFSPEAVSLARRLEEYTRRPTSNDYSSPENYLFLLGTPATYVLSSFDTGGAYSGIWLMANEFSDDDDVSATVTLFSINSTSPNQAAAWELVKFLTSGESAKLSSVFELTCRRDESESSMREYLSLFKRTNASNIIIDDVVCWLEAYLRSISFISLEDDTSFQQSLDLIYDYWDGNITLDEALERRAEFLLFYMYE